MSALDPLTDEQREIRELVRTIARERVAPRAAEIDKSGGVPVGHGGGCSARTTCSGSCIDEAYGGIGESSLMTFVMIEELSKVCATSGLIIAVQELGSLGIKLAGTEEQKQRFLPRLASGEWLAAYALTEPGSGSDSAAMRTTALRDGDDYVLSGGKRFITNAGVASVYVVFAKTEPAAGARAGSRRSWSRRTRRGSRWGGSSRRWGSRARRPVSSSSTIAGSRPGTCSASEGEGFKIAMRILDRSRPGIGAQGLGLAQGATDYAVEYARVAGDDGQARSASTS